MRITSLGHHIAVTMTNPCGLIFEASLISSSQLLALVRIWSCCRRLQICSDQGPVSKCLRSLQRDIPSVTALAPRVPPVLYKCTLTVHSRRPSNVQPLYESKHLLLFHSSSQWKYVFFTCMAYCCVLLKTSQPRSLCNPIKKVLINFFMGQSFHFTVKTFRMNIAGEV